MEPHGATENNAALVRGITLAGVCSFVPRLNQIRHKFTIFHNSDIQTKGEIAVKTIYAPKLFIQFQDCKS